MVGVDVDNSGESRGCRGVDDGSAREGREEDQALNKEVREVDRRIVRHHAHAPQHYHHLHLPYSPRLPWSYRSHDDTQTTSRASGKHHMFFAETRAISGNG